MNKEEPIRDQAERLRQKIHKNKDEPILEKKLPSRSDLHRNKKSKTKWTLKYPVIRLLALFFILIPIVFISVYSALGSNKVINSEKVSSETSGAEEIDLRAIKDLGKGQDSSLGKTDIDESLEDVPNKNENEMIVNEPTKEKTNEVTLPSTDKDQKPPVNQTNDLSEKVVYHTVGKSENLFRISMKYYQSQEGIEIIKQANHIQGNEIRVGQVLIIPK